MLFISGLCALLYQLIWTRLAYASFGIISPVLSVIISVFMLGLALGSWLAGKYIGTLIARFKVSAIYFYAAAEAAIGLGAICVPLLFGVGSQLLLSSGDLDSATYLAYSATLIALAILPFCFCMGATLPLMMAYMRENSRSETTSFSFLYTANLLGALAGTALTSIFLIELLGFRLTLYLGAALNLVVAGLAIALGRQTPATAFAEEETDNNPVIVPDDLPARLVPLILFATGMISMAMEVAWTRAFFSVLGNEVYSFAGLLFTYLLATFLGARSYRKALKGGRPRSTLILFVMLAFASLLPVLLNDPRVHVFASALLIMAAKASGLAIPMEVVVSAPAVLIVLSSIVPFCYLLGYLTPKLIDGLAAGDPRQAGSAYAINVIGCIIGPLVASYLLLPNWTGKDALTILALLCTFLWLFALPRLSTQLKLLTTAAMIVMLSTATFVAIGYEEFMRTINDPVVVKRDYAATSLACGKGFDRNLIVNGVGMTALDQCTKTMAHLPIILNKGTPEEALTICFGMGTTFRALLSWQLDTTAVELVPGVRDLFGFFHEDAAQVVSSPHGRIVIDDGRRFLRRTDRKFDIVTVDPPPPVEAAGLSLLFSNQFYGLVKQHLKPHGIVQIFVPPGEPAIVSGLLNSFMGAFPHVKVFKAPGAGFHFVGSLEELVLPPVPAAAAKFGPKATADLTEWHEDGLVKPDLHSAIADMYKQEIPVQSLLLAGSKRISDDNPANEYFLLGRLQRLNSLEETKH